MPIEQIVAMGAIVGAVLIYSFLASRKAVKAGAEQLASIGPGVERLRQNIANTRKANEGEPVCVVAYHYTKRSVELVFIGVTDQRILVTKDNGPMNEYPYDYEAEHLPAAQKSEQNKGFFFWAHEEKTHDGRSAYTPEVKNYAPFQGEEWYMYPEVPGHPEQLESLRKFSSIFYFKWFY